MNQTRPETAAEPQWHLKLFGKSLTKQAKLREILRLLGPAGAAEGLDLGGDNGVISYFLRRHGGTWCSADLSPKAVASIRQLVGGDVREMTGSELPFEDARFDVVVVIDLLEHVRDDARFIEECHRVLKPAGRLIVNVPHVKRGAVLRPIRRLLGLTDERHGHVRPGYTESQLFDLLKDGFDVKEAHTYSRFFVEALDTVIQFASKAASRGASDAKGVMLDRQDFGRVAKLFRVYSVLYPFFLLAAQLDALLSFTRGYSLIGVAHKRPWRPRRAPVLSDGRSIAEAALGSKIGTAAPF
jgi:SAM-dependent methyltransferase